VYAKGTEITGTSDAGFAEAVHAAEQADVVVMALGESGAMSGEAGSRAHPDLPGNQEKLLEVDTRPQIAHITLYSFRSGTAPRICKTVAVINFRALSSFASRKGTTARDSETFPYEKFV
jgi:hypothetical protein